MATGSSMNCATYYTFSLNIVFLNVREGIEGIVPPPPPPKKKEVQKARRNCYTKLDCKE